MKVKVLQGQSLFDIAIQKIGSAEGAFDLAVLNGLSLTDELASGSELSLPAATNSSVVAYYMNREIQPATALSSTDILIQ